MKKRVTEASSKYDKKISAIERDLGYEDAIEAWVRGISVDDGKEFLGYFVNEREIPIDEIHDRRSLFDAMDEIIEYFTHNPKELFDELFYNISDDVAKYLINGIYQDYDLDVMYDNKKTIKLKKDYFIEGNLVSKGSTINLIKESSGKRTLNISNSVDDIGNFWVVTKDIYGHSTLQDILFEADIFDMHLQFNGGLNGEDVLLVTFDKNKAEKLAKQVLGV